MKSAKILVGLVCSLALGVSTAFCQNTLISKTANPPGERDLTAYRKSVYDNPPAPDGYVNDYEDLFSTEENEKLDSLIRDFDKKTGIEIALISFDTSMSCIDSLESLSLKMANTWGVGEKDKNNGVIIGVCSGYGKVKILYGMGLEGLISDKETNQIVNTNFVPYYEKDQYYQGTVTGLTTLMNLLKTRYHR